MHITPQNIALIIAAILLGASAVALVAALIVGMQRTSTVEHSPNQTAFTAGTVPSQLPDGFYQGSVSPSVPRGDWQGKKFTAANATGTNQFTSGQRYNFKIYPAQGLRDKNTQVLRIDYHQPGNPWWLGFIVDEIVLTTPGHYLGKVHLHVAGLTFTLTYFELNQEH